MHVSVPPGRYQVEAESASGSESVRGLDAVADAPFAIQALSSSGNVSVRGSAVIAALDLDRRLERASHAAAYLVVNVPIAILGALSVLALVLGAALSVAWIGLPLLLGAAAAVRRLVRLDRRAANRFLGTHIPPVPAGVATTGNPWRRSLEILSDRALWRMVALLATKPLLIAGLCIVALVPLALLAEILSLGVQGVARPGHDRLPGPVASGPRPRTRPARARPRGARCS